MFKIAYGAGHNSFTKNGIPGGESEWFLNDRIARYFAEEAKKYPVELLRVDDALASVSLAKRCKAANDWGADFFLSIHHNAGINGGSGGGLVAFSSPGSVKGAQYRDAIYDACMASGGLKGDRWDGTLEHGYYVLKNTDMPAVLMEYGFMDSTVDAPVIVTDEYARAMARATMEGIAKVAGLTANKTIYRVQVGAFNQKENAYALAQTFKDSGYDAFITEETG